MNQKKKPKTLHQALKYRELSWPVIPLHSSNVGKCTCDKADCRSPGKHPRTKYGFRDATLEKKVVNEWFSTMPDSNIGIATGLASRLLILDVDKRNGGFDTLARVENELGPLPQTLTVATGGGGKHFYFNHPKKKIKKDSHGKLFGPGIDVLTDGTYAVAVGSRHVSGEKYRWEISPKNAKVADLPKAWLNRLKKKRSKKTLPKSDNALIVEGQRNNSLAAFVGKLIHSGVGVEDLLETALSWNQRRCSPPLASEEVERVVASTSRYATDTKEISDPAEIVTEALLRQHYAAGKHLTLGAGAQFWSYGGKKWAVCSTEVIQGKILETIASLPLKLPTSKNTLMRHAMELLKPKLSNKPQIDLTAPLPSVINCNNGELWINQAGDVELRPHRPESLLRHCLDIEYDPTAKCPRFEKALNDIFSRAKNPEDLIRHWHELTGYLIQPTRKIPLILILFGGGGNGKTELVKIVATLMGEELVQWDRIADASSNRFFFGTLSDKLMLVDDDVTIGMKLPDGELKKISEAKKLTGERKYGAPFNFTCLAAPVLLCNSPMSLSDVGMGMQRRLMVVPFERHFTEQEIDRNLFRIIAETELPGILNLAIEGYRRIVQRGNHFEKPKAVLKAGEKWFNEANPVATFLNERCERATGAMESTGALYDAFCAWADTAGITMKQQKISFTRNVVNILGTVKKKTNTGTSIVGVRLKKS
ncbi:hypothetical protein FY133_00840 [Agrobacterium tumefaciens]|uniref:phage/plasmid primase, P4 family n=1 Tax=Agrobacterium tumefaciens TaxID=358 RepID=UPI0021D1DAC7|nr:phage/plasmid primase, P4 family [Agrobacterium tumefaciens]UXT64192.1 hypothetical protein FY133_00840 [Agrobacterium tumefaciens]